MGIILDLLEYIHVNKDPNTIEKRGKKHIREIVKNTSMKLAALISFKIATATSARSE
jgi:hypothetical protein